MEKAGAFPGQNRKCGGKGEEMDTILLLLVGVMCLWTGMKTLYNEERNTIFNKRSIEVTDVKKYNQLCGYLILGFGAAAEITIYFMCKASGLISGIFSIILIAEALLVVVIYNRIERKLLKRR